MKVRTGHRGRDWNVNIDKEQYSYSVVIEDDVYAIRSLTKLRVTDSPGTWPHPYSSKPVTKGRKSCIQLDGHWRSKSRTSMFKNIKIVLCVECVCVCVRARIWASREVVLNFYILFSWWSDITLYLCRTVASNKHVVHSRVSDEWIWKAVGSRGWAWGSVVVKALRY